MSKNPVQPRSTESNGDAFASTDLKSILIVAGVVAFVVILVCIIMFWRVFKLRGNQTNVISNNNVAHDQVNNYSKVSQRDVLIQNHILDPDHRNWNIDDVAVWIAQIENGKYKQYAVLFQQQQVDGNYIKTITKNDLATFGITSYPDRVELCKEISLLSNRIADPRKSSIEQIEGRL